MSDSTESPKTSKTSKKRVSKRGQNVQPSELNSSAHDGADYNCACVGHITTINAKLDKILSSLDSLESRLTGLEVKLHEVVAKTQTRHSETEDLKSAMSEVENWRKTILPHINRRHDAYEEISVLKNQIDDLQNRSRRNNIILYGIPEGSEGDQQCENFMSDFIADHMQLDGGRDIKIGRAHRTPGRRPTASSSSRPRTIHCKLLRSGDREYILRNASKCLRNKTFKKSKVFITDDVTERVRHARKRLRENELQEIRNDDRVHFAYIPFSLPPVIKFKLHTGAFKTHRPGDEISLRVAQPNHSTAEYSMYLTPLH